ncbi:hypothetical protein QMZ92_11940 [Streptomyces sp. HNM0645]|uniref:hypothetical protein n=1 Tax=Streptomyces sp. HNM0645 TaxID=2782343 RepID=UPI0024B820F3|nr:hypothetical protein [Streptomyces sp. HNM0645]MDI9885086.1 hypothetical protein [Streptomyces sp. HNM0645]
MSQMPGTVRSVRAVLHAVGAGSVLASLGFVVAAATLETGALGALFVGLLLLAALLLGVFAVTVIARKFAGGGNRVRIGAVAIGSLLTLGGAIGLVAHSGAWGAWAAGVAAGLFVTVLSTGDASREWFDLPRR